MSGGYGIPRGHRARHDPAAQAYAAYLYGPGMAGQGAVAPAGLSNVMLGSLAGLGSAPFEGALTYDQFSRLYNSLGYQGKAGGAQGPQPYTLPAVNAPPVLDPSAFQVNLAGPSGRPVTGTPALGGLLGLMDAAQLYLPQGRAVAPKPATTQAAPGG